MATTGAGLDAVTADLERMVQELRSRQESLKVTYRLADSWAVAFRFRPDECEMVEKRLDIHAQAAVLSARADAVASLESLGDGAYRLRLKTEPGELTIRPDRYPAGRAREKLLEA
ncbi:MAG: hypothetical protein QJR08_10400 [Bacillota bacterium]|nr:hypothetical protein [Bacillota bacterium]